MGRAERNHLWLRSSTFTYAAPQSGGSCQVWVTTSKRILHLRQETVLQGSSFKLREAPKADLSIKKAKLYTVHPKDVLSWKSAFHSPFLFKYTESCAGEVTTVSAAKLLLGGSLSSP